MKDKKEKNESQVTEEKEKISPGKRKSSPLYTIGILICIAVIIFAAWKLISIYLTYKEGTDEYDELRQYATETVDSSSDSSDSSESVKSISYNGREETEDFRTSEDPPVDVDWDSLKAINEDIVGWLYIEGVDISYPIVQGSDDDYYLHRTFEKKDNFAGSIFMEYKNTSTFTDPNTIIYGHNMKNGSMFGNLKHIASDKTYEDHPWFWILTPDGNYRYRMFSIRTAAVDDETYTLFMGTDQSFVDWCNEMYEESDVSLQKPDFSLDSKIVTLSTCTTDSDHRFVVQGVAVK
jgi:sortase B